MPLLSFTPSPTQAPKGDKKFDGTLTNIVYVVIILNKPNRLCIYNVYAEGVIFCLYVDEILCLATNINVIKEVER